MNCPTTDKLSLYVDELVTPEEMNQITNHTKHCSQCKHLVETFRNEQLFLKETLQLPSLPEDFASDIINKLEPYAQKKVRKTSPWKRVMLTAAGIMIGFGLMSTFNPAFAQWVEGLFSSDQVDEGLQMAKDAGFGKRVNKEVTDQNITLKVEDAVADTSRIAVSYQILKNGKPVKKNYIDSSDTDNKVFLTDKNGKELEMGGSIWTNAQDSEYGLFEFSLDDEQQFFKEVIIKFDLVELDGKKGKWELEVPVDLRETQKATIVVALNGVTTSQHGVQIKMNEVRYAPSSSGILYETSFTKEENANLAKAVKQYEKKYGKEALIFTDFGSAIQYHIEDEKGNRISSRNSFVDEKGHPTDADLLHGSGRPLDQEGKTIGHTLWNEAFIPQKNPGKLTFVLDGIFKTTPSDFSLKIKPEELRNKPVTFKYLGNYFTIRKAKKHSDYSLQKSFMPIKRETYFEIEMDGSKDLPAAELNAWVLVDNKGNVYPTYRSGQILDEKDKHGRFKSNYQLRCYDLKDVPEELTLRLLSETRYYKVNSPWRVPIN